MYLFSVQSWVVSLAVRPRTEGEAVTEAITRGEWIDVTEDVPGVGAATNNCGRKIAPAKTALNS